MGRFGGFAARTCLNKQNTWVADSLAPGVDVALMSACQGEQFIRVEDVVAVALLGQKQLTVVGEIQLLCIARDDGVEVGRASIRLRAQDPPKALGLFLA